MPWSSKIGLRTVLPRIALVGSSETYINNDCILAAFRRGSVAATEQVVSQKSWKDVAVAHKKFNVAQLFRGASTRVELERAPADAAQRVIFSTPSLGHEVVVSLDGIMVVGEAGNAVPATLRIFDLVPTPAGLDQV